MKMIVVAYMSLNPLDCRIVKQDLMHMSGLFEELNQLGRRGPIIIRIPIRTRFSFFVFSDQSDIHLQAVPVASMIGMFYAVSQTYIPDTKFPVIATGPAKGNLLNHCNKFGMCILASTGIRRSV